MWNTRDGVPTTITDGVPATFEDRDLIVPLINSTLDGAKGGFVLGNLHGVEQIANIVVRGAGPLELCEFVELSLRYSVRRCSGKQHIPPYILYGYTYRKQKGTCIHHCQVSWS